MVFLYLLFCVGIPVNQTSSSRSDLIARGLTSFFLIHIGVLIQDKIIIHRLKGVDFDILQLLLLKLLNSHFIQPNVHFVSRSSS